MKTARLSPIIVGAVGTVLSLLAIGLIFFLMIKPTQESITAQQARLDAAAPGTEPLAPGSDRQRGLDANKKKGQADLLQAKVDVKNTKMQWAQVESAIMPPLDVSDRYKAMRQLTYELTHYLAPDLQRQLATTGITSTTKFALPAPPLSPNDPMIRAGVLVIPLGTVSVNGDFRHILTHFNDWQYFNRLVMVDGLNLVGNSPYMQGSYNATLYIFPQNDDKLPPLKTKAGGAGAAGAAGAPGGGGGYPVAATPAAVAATPAAVAATPAAVAVTLGPAAIPVAIRAVVKGHEILHHKSGVCIEGFPAGNTQSGYD